MTYKYTFVKVISTIFFVSFFANSHADVGLQCNDCNDWQRFACAQSAGAEFQLTTGARVWVVDFTLESYEHYRLQVTPPGHIIRGSRGEPLSVPRSMVMPIPLAPAPDMAEGAQGLIVWTNTFLLPNGIQSTLPRCIPMRVNHEGMDLDSQDARDLVKIFEAPMGLRTAFTQVIIAHPESGFTSAYDVIGNVAAGRQLGVHLTQQLPALAWGARMGNWISRVVTISPVDVEVDIRVDFPDGSKGRWIFNSHLGAWEADFTQFSDSDGNPIPYLVTDLAPGAGYQFSGQAPGDENLENFLDRLRILGVPFVNGGSGNLPTRCTVEGDGRLRCVPV